MAEDNSWKTPSFRQSVVNKINEAIQQSGMTSSKNGLEMENHVFQKARNKDEYLGYVARLILHVREMNTKNKNQQNPAGSAQDGGNPNQQGGGMPDPINALQTLATQGTRPQMMGGQMGGPGPGGPMGNQMGGGGNASNLLNTLNRPQMPMTGGMANMQGRVGAMGGPNQMGGMMPGQMPGGMPGMPNQMGGAMGPGGMSGGKIVGQMNPMGGMNPMQMGVGGMPQGAGQQQPQGPQGQGQGGPGGPNPMGGMGMQVNPGGHMGQNAMNQQMNQVGMSSGGNQMGNLGGNSPMNTGMGGIPPNQVIRQQMPPGMNPNQQQLGMAGGQMGQMNPGVGGPGGNLGPVQQQQQPGQVGMPGMGPGGGPGNLQQSNNPQQQPQGGPNAPPGQMNQVGGPGGNMQAMSNQGNFVPIGANPMVRKQDMMSGGQVYPGGVVRSVTPNQFLRQSPSPSVPSPAGPGSIGPQSHPGQMIPSPALIPSPSPQVSSNIPAPRNIGQSPGQSLNTPGQAAAPSPLNPQEEHLYKEKYRSLQKYIEPLKRMIAKMEHDDVDKMGKMKRLLDILCNPTCRIPLETLYKCEAALTSQLGTIREPPLNNPLVEAVSANLQSPLGNHTLQRTFRPCLEALFGPDIKNLPSPAKQSRLAIDEPSSSALSGGPEIPHILQGEIARLDQKFKVSLDPCAIGDTKTIKLICWLDDKHLPCVPPIAVTIPEEYPFTSPSCSLIEQEYNATPFLIQVQKSLVARICKLPEMFSLSHLLDTWEMSVRQACSPNPSRVAPSATSVLLGM
ncbi:mediator of RNA polymerase II transcription subunit 15 [Aedes albopictus]|uniref:Mediator of RNA polymerase II transcription subunit 15 n=1 Tax=Aedes albopictus TaxID=7160 RepID=A0ABM1Z6F9_AEDAL|nr:mediator of RNA polymerase II transcription subunit 15-like isoform X1 [Aedes albopictus]